MFELVKYLTLKINKLIAELPILEAIRIKIEGKEEIFLTYVKKEHLFLGALCILALIFDFGLTQKTMKPIAQIWGTNSSVLALLFNLIDAFIAIMASGILAKTLIDKVKHKKVWRPVLWSLCIIKLSLFFATIKITGKNSIWAQILLVLLSIVVYIILDLGGGGLYYLVGKIKYYTLLEIWHPKPHDIQIKISKLKRELEQKCVEYQYPYEDVKNHFGLKY